MLLVLQYFVETENEKISAKYWEEMKYYYSIEHRTEPNGITFHKCLNFHSFMCFVYVSNEKFTQY